MHRLWALVLLFLVLGTSCTSTEAPASSRVEATPVATPTVTPSPTPTPLPPFDIGRAMDDIRALSVDIGIREGGTPGERRAAGWIRDRLVEVGMEARLESFPVPQGGESQNVVGAPPGFEPAHGPYLLVGGHYDSLRGPGANDNATGVAVALEAVRAGGTSLPLLFVAFGAEERQPAPGNPHHIGSIAFVEAMTPAERENLVAYVNIDMVGFGDTITLGRLDVGPTEATDRLVRLADELGIHAHERVLPDWSDHGTFLKAGLNAGWLWTGEDARFHSPRDTFDHVQPEAVERSGRLALAALRSYP